MQNYSSLQPGSFKPFVAPGVRPKCSSTAARRVPVRSRCKRVPTAFIFPEDWPPSSLRQPWRKSERTGNLTTNSPPPRSSASPVTRSRTSSRPAPPEPLFLYSPRYLKRPCPAPRPLADRDSNLSPKPVTPPASPGRNQHSPFSRSAASRGKTPLNVSLPEQLVSPPSVYS